MVAASSALLLINGTAAAFGPVLTGALMAAFGTRAYFGVLGSLTGALTLFDLWRKLRRGPVPRSQKGPFLNTRELATSVGPDPAAREVGPEVEHHAGRADSRGPVGSNAQPSSGP